MSHDSSVVFGKSLLSAAALALCFHIGSNQAGDESSENALIRLIPPASADDVTSRSIRLHDEALLYFQSHSETMNSFHGDAKKVTMIDAASNTPLVDTGSNTRSVKSDNVWERIRSGYEFADLDNKIVRKYEKFYSENPKHMDQIIERARLYLPYIVSEVERKELPLELALLPVVESAYNPRAYSVAGAAGLWQFMPFTGKQYGLKQDWWYEGRRDIIESTDAALRHLQDLGVAFDNDWHLALAAYNAGMYGVKRAIRKNVKRNKPTDYSSLDLRLETRHFVPKLIAVRNIIADPEAFGVTLPDLSMSSTFEIIDFNFQVDLGIMASATNIDEFKLAQFNPGLRRTVTPPGGPYRILVPAGSQQTVLDWKTSLAPSHAVTTVLHNVSSGDVLSRIAQEYNVSVAAIMSVNSMRSDMIRVGETIRIPRPTSIAKSELGSNFGSTVVYRVKRGDVLGTIAEKFGVSVSKIRSANLLHSNLIRVGQKLQIPVPGSSIDQGKIARSSQPESKGTQHVTHTVRRGDSLYKIASTYDVSVAKLRATNSLESDRIYVGQKVAIPKETPAPTTKIASAGQSKIVPATRFVYTVRSGDTLWDIARTHQTSVSSLMKWNEIGREQILRTGQRIVIYVD